MIDPLCLRWKYGGAGALSEPHKESGHSEWAKVVFPLPLAWQFDPLIYNSKIRCRTNCYSLILHLHHSQLPKWRDYRFLHPSHLMVIRKIRHHAAMAEELLTYTAVVNCGSVVSSVDSLKGHGFHSQHEICVFHVSVSFFSPSFAKKVQCWIIFLQLAPLTSAGVQ